MSAIAVRAAQSVRYDSVGTIEFIYDIRKKAFYFIEMNTRIQVEHPVTEMITQTDLIKHQILVATGEPLSLTQEQIHKSGHAIECRINAEDPENNFMPQSGTLSQYIVPGGPGVRVDSGVYPGYAIPPYYDSMIAKLIVWGDNRKDAVARMKRALREFVIEGVKTTIPFHLQILQNKDFLSGAYTTGFIGKMHAGQGRPLMLSKLFVKCPQCSTTHFYSFFKHAYFVCSRCGYHFRLDAPTWLKQLCDRGTFQEMDEDLKSLDPLGFPKYESKLAQAVQQTGANEAVMTGSAEIEGCPAALAVMEPNFIMASMGSVVGEKIARLLEYAALEQIARADDHFLRRRAHAGGDPVADADGQNRRRHPPPP